MAWQHRRSQDFVCGGALFLARKVDDLFLVVALKDHLNMPPNLTRPAKKTVHFVSCGDALTHFTCKLCLKNFFSPPSRGCRCTHCTPWLRLWPGNFFASQSSFHCFVHDFLTLIIVFLYFYYKYCAFVTKTLVNWARLGKGRLHFYFYLSK